MATRTSEAESSWQPAMPTGRHAGLHRMRAQHLPHFNPLYNVYAKEIPAPPSLTPHPRHTLSPEILCHIMEYLGPPELYVCLFVCRRWFPAAATALWRHPPVHSFRAASNLLKTLTAGLDQHLCADKITFGVSEKERQKIRPLLNYRQLLRSIDLSRLAVCGEQWLVTDAFVASLLDAISGRGEVGWKGKGKEGWGTTNATLHNTSPLRQLNLSLCSKITARTLRHLSMQNFQLHSLCLSDCIRLTTESLLELLSEVSVVCSLRYLDLSGCHAAVTDAVVKAVVDTCWPSLESLSLASCTRITEEGITYLARASCRYRSGFVSLDWEENLFDQQRNHPAHWADSESPLSIPSHALLRLRKLDLSYINLSHKAADACGCLGASLIALHLAECEVEGKPANNSYRSNRDGWIVSLLRESRKLRELDVHGIRSVRAPGSVHEDDEEHNLYQAGQVLAMQQSQEAQDQHDEQMQDLQKKYHQMQQSIYQWQIDQSNACELPKAIFTRVSESSLSNYVSSSSELVASPGSPQTDYSDQISEGSDDSFSSGTSAALFIDPDSASSTSSLHTTILNTIPTLPHLSNLSHLNLGHFTTATDSQLSILMRHCGPDLRSLNLSHCVSLTDATALSISRHCRALRELTLYSVEKLSDTGLAFVASQCGPGLGWLNLAQCAEIGSYGVESVARYCTSLRVLNVGGCRGKPGIGFDVLAELARRCRQLKVVRVAGTGINQEDLDALEDNFRWIYWDVT